jgi:hypothetical protein
LDPKKRLTIALQVAQVENKPLHLARLIEPQPTGDSRVYEYLRSIGCAYVTTNYDRYLDRFPTQVAAASTKAATATSAVSPSPKLICRPHQFMAQRLREPGTVVHLHGSMDDPDSMVVTTSDYLSHYGEPHVQAFLDELFNRFTILFIGYGLEESEVLEHVLRKGTSRRQLQASRFMLSGYFSHQERTFGHMQRYYKESFGVHLVPFGRDHSDHAQLEHVLQDWSGRLKVGSPLLADDLAFVLEVADE